ncbi:MAG: hypothetical protein CFE22_16615 [Cytophagaceae bacterium BCCC1]|jgi:hypothetical protein|nr:hypothetical protein [Leadbetterella sp.]OYU64850.1 MAG: hypothetical protein CFE22_16615 [Cytophagaceae bacterium BCCC1]
MLQIAVAVLYFINKVLLSLEKKSGWQIGILASCLAIFYFYSLDLYLLVGLEVGFMAILIFGLINHNQEIKYENMLYLVMIFLLIFLYFVLKNSTLLEFLISLDFILAIFFLAKKKDLVGWIFMLLGHFMMGYFTYTNQQTFFAIMQFLSVFVSLFAIYRNRPFTAL